MPSVCERCLPDNPYVQMLKEVRLYYVARYEPKNYGLTSLQDYGEACKLCTRPFTVSADNARRTSADC